MGNVISRYFNNTPPDQPWDFSVYDAFGMLRGYRNGSNATQYPVPPDPVGYGGQWGNYTDVDTGLVLMTYRYYDPGSCRFLTRDPMGYEGGINLYAYCRNNPITRFDPLGLQDPADYEPPLSNAQGSYKPLMNTFHSGAKFGTKVLKGTAALNPGVQAFEAVSGKRATEVNQNVPLWERALTVGVYAVTLGGFHINLPLRTTAPTLPANEVATVGEVRFVHHYGGEADHLPLHIHVEGGGIETKILPNGSPAHPSPAMTATQRRAFDRAKKPIGKAFNKIGRWLDYQSPGALRGGGPGTGRKNMY